ncbi:MAG: HAMP domain-containing histidine kinase, partial [Leptospiraceae bacterium]|nr:HAMP domain-containing histidine kinase [Leptospiraceae bacterium]
IYLNETLAKEKKLEIRKNLKGDIFIKGNKFEFSQVITNLVVNAIKYTDDGYISVSCQKTQDGYCEIKVKDTGIGIDSKYHSAIFERFFRVPDFQNRKVGGTGIGLAISKEIIEKMGGSIKLESELGKGSEFKILIPSAV